MFCKLQSLLHLRVNQVAVFHGKWSIVIRQYRVNTYCARPIEPVTIKQRANSPKAHTEFVISCKCELVENGVEC